jgi:hypothetical protein
MSALTCPYCNSFVPVASGVRAGQSVVCPRCGDAFTLPAPTAITTAPVPGMPPSGVTTSLPAAALPPPRRLSNRFVAGIILAVMGCMATVALVYALSTQDFRRSVDRGIPSKPRRAPPPVAVELPPQGGPPAVRPDQLEGLGYLPKDVDLILAIQAGELLSAPIAPTLFQNGIRVSRLNLHPELVARMTGLALQDLDHLVVGLKLDTSVPPHLWIVGRTKEPYDAEKLRDKLGAQRVADTGQRVIHRFQLKQSPFPLNLFCPDDRTTVVALLAGDLKSIPAARNEKLDQLNPELVQVIRERCEVSAVWLAAHVEKWEPVLSRPLVADYSKKMRELLMGVRTMAVSLHLDNALTLKAAIHCKDSAAAGALNRFFQAQRQGDTASLKMQQDDAWLAVQLRTDLAGLQKSLSP